MDFKDADAFNNALELNGVELGYQPLTVEEARPRGDFNDGPGSNGRGRGRSGGRDGGGRFSGRRGRGDFSGGRGRGSRGRGPSKPSFTPSGTGT